MYLVTCGGTLNLLLLKTQMAENPIWATFSSAITAIDAITTESADKAAAKQHMDLTMISLRRLNRQSTLRSREMKQMNAAERERLDELHLARHNLESEKRHLEKELDSYINLKTLYQAIPLHPIDEFLRLTGSMEVDGESLSASSDRVSGGDHSLMLKRLEFEWEERKRLAAKLEEETATRNELLVYIQARKDEMASIDRQLSELRQNCRAMFESENQPTGTQSSVE